MKLSLNWLSDLIDLSVLTSGSAVQTAQKVGAILTSRGIEVEAIENLSAGFDKVVVARILEMKPHPQADRLRLCQVERGPAGPNLEIVCGATNMKVGDKVALAQEGAILPNGLKIVRSKIRGVESCGMLCSEEELKLKEKADGILILPASIEVGQPLAQVLGREDVVLDLAITPNRGDCMSHLGIARELAAALKIPLRYKAPKKMAGGNSPIQTRCEAGEDGLQFYGCFIEGVKIGPSPQWLSRRLEALGARSINNVVDATNLVLHELGQPVHAYDAARLKGTALSIRYAKQGEKLPLLDGTQVLLEGSELVIADDEKPVALAGVMGGGNSEVQPSTTRVFLEVAEFAPVAVRRAGAKHQKRTESSARFERGIDPDGVARALDRLTELVVEVGGGRVVGATSAHHASRGKGLRPTRIMASPDYIGSFLGIDISSLQIEEILTGLGCSVGHEGGAFLVQAPFYRRDLAIPQDLAEEVARSIGYEKIPATIPSLTSSPLSLAAEGPAPAFALIEKAKDVMAGLGFCETIHYAFTSKQWLSKFDMNAEVAVLNPLSEEQEVMVPSLLPGMIKSVLDNWHRHFGADVPSVRLFELRPTFFKKDCPTSNLETAMSEKWKLCLVMTGSVFSSALESERREVDFYDLSGIFQQLIAALDVRGVRLMAESSQPATVFHSGRSAKILAGKDAIGTLGQVHPRLARTLKCKAPVWAAEFEWEPFARLSRPIYEAGRFEKFLEFPTMDRDFALVVGNQVKADQITQIALREGKPIVKSARVFDIYRGKQVAEGMTSVAVRVIFGIEGRSLQEGETEEVSQKILARWKKELGAELR